MARTGALGAVVELANQLHRALQGMEMAIAMVANVHRAPTDRTNAVQDVEFPLTEIGILGPCVRHPANLQAESDPSLGQTRQQFTPENHDFLAILRAVVENKGGTVAACGTPSPTCQT